MSAREPMFTCARTGDPCDMSCDPSGHPQPCLPPRVPDRVPDWASKPALTPVSPPVRGILSTDSLERKGIPMARGLLDYFPAALPAVAHLSQVANDKHNPGEEMHWSRTKSDDHADCILRHLIDRGLVDEEDGVLHSVKVAWRALALAQLELEALGAPKARGAR